MPDDRKRLDDIGVLDLATSLEQRLADLLKIFGCYVCPLASQLTPRQMLLLLRIPYDGCQVGHLQTRGAYTGENASHNVQKLLDEGFIASTPGPHDRRTKILRRTEKGEQVFQRYRELFVSNEELRQELAKIIPA